MDLLGIWCFILIISLFKRDWFETYYESYINTFYSSNVVNQLKLNYVVKLPNSSFVLPLKKTMLVSYCTGLPWGDYILLSVIA